MPEMLSKSSQSKSDDGEKAVHRETVKDKAVHREQVKDKAARSSTQKDATK